MYRKIHIKNAIFLTIMYKMYLKFFESFTATVKFHDKTSATWSDSSKDRRQIERQTVSIILIFSLHRCLQVFNLAKWNFTQKFFAISFFFLLKFRIKTSKVPLVGLPMMLLITGKEKGKTKRNRQCWKDLLWTTSSVYGTHKKEDIELFIEKANNHPTHIKFFLLVKYQK